MATSQATKSVSVIAGAVLRIYRYVSLQADGKFDESGANALIDGICAEAAAADGDVFPMVVPDGAIVKVECGAAVTRGARLMSDAQGRAIDFVSGVGVGRGGIALDAGSAAGSIIRALFITDEDQVV